MNFQPESTKHGLIIEPPSQTDYVAGVNSTLSGEEIIDGDWTPYIIDWEHQAPRFETNGCASFGWVDALQGLKKQFDGSTFNLSDRFLAKISGTDPKRGNSPQKVAQTLREDWSCLEEDWPMEGVNTVEEYYREPADLLYSKAKIIKGEDEFFYHNIPNPTLPKIREELKRGAVCMSVALMPDENGLWHKPTGWSDGHWVWVLKVNDDGTAIIKDTYEPFKKTVRADFIPQVAYRGNINEVQVDWLITSLKALLKKLQDYIASLKPAPIIENPTPKDVLINAFAKAIEKHEDYVLPGGRYRSGEIAPQGSVSFRCRNPGNARFYIGGYLAKYGEVRESTLGKNVEKGIRGFAVFSSYEVGFMYLKNLILEKARKLPSDNLFDFFKVYAPKEDNNDPIKYAEAVAKAMNVNPATWRLSNLL